MDLYLWHTSCARSEVHDYKDRLPRHASLPQLAQAFAAAGEEASRVSLHVARIESKTLRKSKTANQTK